MNELIKIVQTGSTADREVRAAVKIQARVRGLIGKWERGRERQGERERVRKREWEREREGEREVSVYNNGHLW